MASQNNQESPVLLGTPTLRRALGGDVLSSDAVRSHIGLFMLIVFFIVLYIASRYQCQQDLIIIDNLKRELLDAKYKALSTQSDLTEKSRKSHIMQALHEHGNTTLHDSEQPPYIITLP